MPGRLLRSRAGARWAVAGAMMLIAGCSVAVTVPPGPAAPDPLCARILQATPDTLGGLERRSTTAQATTAWGDPAVTLRCGVVPPGPTTDRCVTVSGPVGPAVDWINPESDDESLPEHARRAQGAWVFVTYGRDPAVEVVVPTEQVADQATVYLLELAEAVGISPAERFCVGATEA